MDSYQYANLSKEAVQWLATGHRGVSSNTLFSLLYGVDSKCTVLDRAAPSDPGDFLRCRLMVDSIQGARELLLGIQDVRARGYERVKILSVVKHWDVLCALMDSELPNWESPERDAKTPKLYEILHLLADQAVAKLTSNPDINATEITGHDLVDERRGRFIAKELDTAGVDTINLRKMVEHFSGVPVMETGLSGRAALQLLRTCVQGIEKLKVAGGDASSRSRIDKLLDSYKGLEKVVPPRGDKATMGIRQHLKRAMSFLWSESHFDRSTTDAAAARELLDMMTRKIREACASAPAAPSEASSPPRRSAAMS